MAKIGSYSYPDIRFGDAVEIAGRILAKFKGSVGVNGLAWELGMAENSGTLFAKIAALRDFGLVEGRGELRVSDLCRKIILSATPEEGRWARMQSFQRVDLLRTLYDRFGGEAPDDSTLLIALEEVTKAPREEIVRRFTLIQKHLMDVARVMKASGTQPEAESFTKSEQTISKPAASAGESPAEHSGEGSGLYLTVGPYRLTGPQTADFVEVAINFLRAVKMSMESKGEEIGASK